MRSHPPLAGLGAGIFLLVFATVGCGARPAEQERGPSPAAVRPYTAAGLMSESGNHAEAARLYDDAAAADPGSTEIWLAASKARIALEQWDEAVERARRAVDLAPRSPRVVDQLGRSLAGGGQLDEAEAVYTDLAARVPESGVPFAGRGMLAAQRGDAEAAEAQLEQAVAKEPDRADWWAALGEARLARGRLAQAAQALDEAARRDPSRRGEDGRIMLMALEAGDRETARRVALRMAGDDAPPGAGSLTVANLLARRGDLLSAANELEWLLGREPENAAARYMLAGILVQVDRPEEARRQLERVPAGSREWADALRMQAALIVEDDPDRAARLLGQARSAGASRPEVIFQLAAALHRAKRLPEARSELTVASAQWPEDARLAYLLALVVHEMDGEDAALPLMEKVIEVEPDHAGALNYVGFTLAERGQRLDEAERMIRRALEARPDDGAIVDSLGWVLFRRGAFAEAVAVLRGAVEQSPEVAEIRFHLAEALSASGDRAAAEAEYARAIELAGTAEEKATYRKAADKARKRRRR